MTQTMDILHRPRTLAATLDELQGPDGYMICEAEDRFWRERAAENVLRLVGVFLILAGYIQWFLPIEPIVGDRAVTQIGLPTLCMGVGAGLYFFARRGFRKMLAIDLSARQVSVARLNTRNHAMICHKLPMADIESFYIQRNETASDMAALQLRMRNMVRPVTVLHGSRAEVETLHGRLCRDIRAAMGCTAPRRTILSKFRKETPRPHGRDPRGLRAPHALAVE